MSSDLEYRPDIDGLRAVAVLSVVAFHLSPKLCAGGFVGVDVFFVISGYLISTIIFRNLEKSRFTIKDFYIRRVKRIFPTLAVVLIATWLMGFGLLLKDEFRQLGKHIYSGTFFFSNITLWKEAGYFDTSAELKPLLHLWSLSIEEQFYIFWPPLFAFAFKRGWNLFYVTIGIIVTSFILNVFLVTDYSTSTFFLLHTRSWELLFGALLAIFELKRPEAFRNFRSNKNSVSILGFLLILISIIFFKGDMLFPGWLALIPIVGSVLLIGAGPEGIINKKILSLKPFIWVGLISYPLYLWHWPLLSFARILDSGEPALHIRWLMVGLAFLLSWLTYEFLEKPVRFLIPKNKEGFYSLIIAGILFVIGGLGLISKNQKNWQLLSGNEQEELFKIPKYSNDECFEEFEADRKAYCNLSAKNPEFAVVGDSHSLAFYPGAYDYFTKQSSSVVQLGFSSCLPLIGVEVHNKGQKEVCKKIIEKNFKDISESNSLRTVILVSRWPAYVNDTDQRKISDSTGSDSRKVIFENGLRRTIEFLKKSQKNIVLVYSVPDLNFQPKSCLKLRAFQFSENRKDCWIDQKSVLEGQKSYREIFSKVLADHPEIKTFDPMTHLCDGSSCYAKINNILVYRDENHLSIEGSKLLSGWFNFVTR